jgi:hypothetical protein
MSDEIPDPIHPGESADDSNEPYQSGGQDWRDPRREARNARREARWEARQARRRSGSSGWVGGAILILLGLIFLFQNFGALRFANWWALFILIPAIGSFASAWNSYQSSGGHLTAAARGSLIGGFVLVLITLAFLFSVNVSIYWPIFLVLGGLALLVNAILPS